MKNSEVGVTRLETFEAAPQGYGAPRSRWFVNLWRHARGETTQRVEAVDRMKAIAVESGGKWTYAERTDGLIPVWPEYLDFENDEDATLFLLRWA